MITLIGHGYVGKYIARELDDRKIEYYWIDHTQNVPWGTNFIINAAGFTGVPNVDSCESNKDACIYGNVIWPLQLEKIATAIGVPVLHISSGCVYTGYKDGGWTENDPPNFTFDNASFYSASKSLFQELFAQYAYKSYLFRIRMPFGPDTDPKNLLTKLTKYDKLVDKINSVSQIQEVAAAAVYFATTSNRPAFGIYNAVNPGGVSTADIAEMLGLDKEYLTPEEEKLVMKAPRSNCVLNTDKMQSVYAFTNSYNALRRSIDIIV